VKLVETTFTKRLRKPRKAKTPTRVTSITKEIEQGIDAIREQRRFGAEHQSSMSFTFKNT